MDWKRIGPGSALFFALLMVISAPASEAANYVSFPGGPQSSIRKYKKFLDGYRNRHCSKDVATQYTDLLKAYQKFGSPIPTLSTNQIDRQTILKNLPLLEEKKKWLQKLHREFKRSKFHRAEISTLTQKIQKSIDQALLEKFRHRFARSETSEKKALADSKKALKTLKADFKQLIQKAFYLKSFKFPVDHLANRRRFEELRLESSSKSQKEKRALRFKRRILEDGAPDPSGTRNDSFIRSTLDSIELALKNPKLEFLGEDLRYDLEWTMRQINQYIRQPKSKILTRFKAWKDQTSGQLAYYQKILNQKKARKKALKELESRGTAWRALSNFVYERHADAWVDLSTQPEWIRSLYAIDMILLNEVGLGTSRNEDDRKDIVQLVINRTKDPFYSSLSPTGPIASRFDEKDLKRSPSSVLPSRKWLNTLFKEGEFSFTLPYIQSVTKVYCPDNSRLVRSTRNKNLRIAYDLLRHPNWDFPALRFYSRNSMLGKIDMSKAWIDYVKLPERPGDRIRKAWGLTKRLKKGQFRYFYTFKYLNRTYDVVEIRNKTYVVRDFRRNPKFYLHRNRHYFAFFKKAEISPGTEKSALRAIKKFRRHFQTSRRTSSNAPNSRPY